MPDRPLTFCRWNGCEALASGTYCPEHTAAHEAKRVQEAAGYDRGRGSTSERGYDRRWQQVRIKYLRAHPLCQDCEARGRIAPARLVHHIVPINDGGPRYDARNLRALCNACHETIHGPERWKKRVDRD